jgi:hypothetical protein
MAATTARKGKDRVTDDSSRLLDFARGFLQALAEKIIKAAPEAGEEALSERKNPPFLQQ